MVDHAKAGKVGGEEAREADEKVAEEGYEERWEGFRVLCEGLGWEGGDGGGEEEVWACDRFESLSQGEAGGRCLMTGQVRR